MATTQSPRPNGWSNRDNSPRRQQMDAQKRQIDLEQAFNDLRIRDAEVEKLHNLHRRIQNEEAELRENSLAKIHQAALDKARKERDVVRQQAETVLQEHLKEEENKRRRREEEERQRLQREAEAKAAQERARLEEEERKKLEQERIRAEADAKAKAERQRQEELKAETERLEREKQQNEQKRHQQAREQKERDDTARAEAAKEAETKAQGQAQGQAQAIADAPALTQAQASTKNETASTKSDDSAETEHQEYIELYYKLKKWKNDYVVESKKASQAPGQEILKNHAGDIRRLIKPELGKLNIGDKELNKMAEGKLTDCLTQLLAKPTPFIGRYIPINFFLPASLNLNDNDETVIADHAAYFLCALSQEIIKIFYRFVCSEPRRAEPIGTMITKMFGNPALQYARKGPDVPVSRTSQSLITILLARYHKVCPGLFGITAPQNKFQGMVKLGWRMELGADGNKSQPVDERTQYDRYTGFAIGYCSFALRNASNAKFDNPYPPKYFWKSLAQLVNLPPDQVQPSHICILRYMFGYDAIKRFLLFFGDVGVAALREAFIAFPGRLPDHIKETHQYKSFVFWANSTLTKDEPLHLT